MKRLVIVLGLVVTVAAVAAAVSMSSGPKQIAVAAAASSSDPQMLSEVPATLPSEGVMVDPAARILLAPPNNVDPASLGVSSAQSAIAYAQPQSMVTTKPSSSAALLAVVTIDATVPPASLAGEEWNTVSDRLCWVVTNTYEKPLLMVYGGHGKDASGDPGAYASHYDVIIDAQTGDLVWGFFTK